MECPRADHTAPASRPPADAAPVRALVHYAVSGDARFLSHLDEVTALTRALTRAGWPLAYSRGFNPLARVVLPLPRSVGTASSCQLALVDLTELPAAAPLDAALRRHLPRGFELQRVDAPAPRRTPHAQAVEYRIAITPQERPLVEQRAARLLSAQSIEVERSFGAGRAARRVDLRPFIESIVTAGPDVVVRLRFEQQRTARPSEVMEQLDLDPETNGRPVRRVAVTWDFELLGPDVRPAALERTEIGNQKEDNHNTHAQDA